MESPSNRIDADVDAHDAHDESEDGALSTEEENRVVRLGDNTTE
jgi:hypothetical protein